MKTSRNVLGFLAAAILSMAGPGVANVVADGAMQIDAKFTPPIAGDSTTAGHGGEISVVSFKLGVSQKGTAATGSGLGAGKAEFEPMTIYKYLDKASARLFVSCAAGTHFTSMVLTLSETDVETQNVKSLLTIELKNVLIESINTDSTTVDNAGRLVESVTLHYNSAFWTYRAPDGQVYSGGWDLKGNKEIKPVLQ